MEIFFLQIIAFFRPIFFIEIGNENIFDLAAILAFALLSVAFLTNAALRQSIRISGIDILIIAFSVWCIAVYVVYFDKAYARGAAQLLIPLFSYIVAKNVLRDAANYRKMLFVMILGFVVPVGLSVILIVTGKGVEMIGGPVVNYWTGITRYQGAYSGAHNFGHNMTFLVMLIVVYVTLSRNKAAQQPTRRAPLRNVLFVILGAAALYCLLMSQVRTAIVGLLVFVVAYLYYFNRRLLIIGTVIVAAIVISMLPTVVNYLMPDVVMVQKGGGDVSDLGSGRATFWANNLSIFIDLPLDRQIAGVGIGNRGENSPEGIVDSHNDYLDVMMQTGIVGFVLFMSIQVLIFKRILKLSGSERILFITFFVAVSVMNLLSNSYIARFGLGQMFYFLLAYLELPSRDSTPLADGELRSEETPEPGLQNAGTMGQHYVARGLKHW